MRKACSLLLTLCFLCVVELCAQAPVTKAEVSIHVVDPTGASVVGAQVRVTRHGTMATSSDAAPKTGPSGRIQISEPPGEYTVDVSGVPGMTSGNVPLTLLEAVNPELEIKLERLACVAYCEPAPNVPEPVLKPVELAAPKPLPKSCKPEDIAKYGRPVFPGSGEVSHGVSSPQTSYKLSDDPKSYIWLANNSQEDINYYMCCESTYLREIRLIDEFGRVLLSEPELSIRKAYHEGQTFLDVCSCSTWNVVKRGECRIVDSGTVTRGYDLKPGRYVVLEGAGPQQLYEYQLPYQTPPPEYVQGRVEGLAITIEGP